MPPSAEHHYVPRFLLRPWTVEGPPGQWNLSGYWWDTRRGQLRCKRKGVAGFCVQLDLLTLSAHNLGRDAIERIFFGSIDTEGAAVCDTLLKQGAERLTAEERSHFARLLLSLEARRPDHINRLRNEIPDFLRRELDRDPEIQQAMKAAGVAGSASAFLENHTTTNLADRAMGMVQRLVENPRVGLPLINAHWGVVRMDDDDECLALSDRPLIRVHGYDNPRAVWVLPLTPKAAFVACNNASDFAEITRSTGNRFAKRANTSSIQQTERFLFSVDRCQEPWIAKHLSRPSAARGR